MIFDWLSNTGVQTCLVGLVAGLVVYWMYQKRRYRLPPGPFALPLIGNLLQVQTAKLHKQMYEWSKQYGPVITLYLGPAPMVIVNNIDTALEVLVKKSTDFANRPRSLTTDLFSDGGKDIALGQFGPTWRLHRKVAGQALRQYLKGPELEKRLHTSINLVFERMKAEQGPFDPKQHITLIVFNLLCGVCYGESYDLGDEWFNHFMDLDEATNEVFTEGVMYEDIIPYLHKVWPTKRFTKFKDAVLELLDIFGQKLKEHKDTFNKDNIRDLTDSLLLARVEAEEEENKTQADNLDDSYLIQTLSDIFFAGLDTSRLTLRFAIQQMAAHTDIQDKAQEELDKVVGHDRLPRLEDRENLSYTEACLHECMRVCTVIPTGVPHESACDTKIGEYDVPKGTTVMVNHWALHHDPKYWGDVGKFNPGHYLDKDGKLGPKPESWLPFSAGRRVCLGESVAKPELHLIFAAILQQFKIRFPEGANVDLEPAGGAFGLYPKDYQVVLEKR